MVNVSALMKCCPFAMRLTLEGGAELAIQAKSLQLLNLGNLVSYQIIIFTDSCLVGLQALAWAGRRRSIFYPKNSDGLLFRARGLGLSLSLRCRSCETSSSCWTPTAAARRELSLKRGETGSSSRGLRKGGTEQELC